MHLASRPPDARCAKGVRMNAYRVLTPVRRVLLGLCLIGTYIAWFTCGSAPDESGTGANFVLWKTALIFTIAFLVMLFCDAFVHGLQKLAGERLARYLNYDCDPALYLTKTSRIKLRSRGFDTSFRLMYLRVRALLYLDRRDEAERLSSSMELPFYRERRGEFKSYMAMLLCSSALLLDQSALQEKCARVIEESAIGGKRSYRSRAKSYLRRLREKQALEQAGDLEGLVEYYSGVIMEETTPGDRLSRVECFYGKAKALEALGRAAEAREAWRYVASYGSRLPYVKEAQDVFGGSSREAQGGNCEERPGADQEEVRS